VVGTVYDCSWRSVLRLTGLSFCALAKADLSVYLGRYLKSRKGFRWNLGTANSRILDFSWFSSNISFCVSHKEFIYYVFIFIFCNGYVISDYACEVWGYLSDIHEVSSPLEVGDGGFRPTHFCRLLPFDAAKRPIKFKTSYRIASDGRITCE